MYCEWLLVVELGYLCLMLIFENVYCLLGNDFVFGFGMVGDY